MGLSWRTATGPAWRAAAGCARSILSRRLIGSVASRTRSWGSMRRPHELSRASVEPSRRAEPEWLRAPAIWFRRRPGGGGAPPPHLRRCHPTRSRRSDA